MSAIEILHDTFDTFVLIRHIISKIRNPKFLKVSIVSIVSYHFLHETYEILETLRPFLTFPKLS